MYDKPIIMDANTHKSLNKREEIALMQPYSLSIPVDMQGGFT